MIKVVVIGASAGGISAIQTIFKSMPGPISVPIVVVLHIHRDTKLTLPLIFGQFYSGQLVEAIDKTEMVPGSVYFATPDYHLLVQDEKTLTLTQDVPVHYSRPSIDVTFASAAFALGAGACGVLLTGASADGAEGLKAIHDNGGFTFVQDPAEAESSVMPLAAIKMFNPSAVLGLKEIGRKLSSLGGRYDIAEK